jgi:hypothetical protein
LQPRLQLGASSFWVDRPVEDDESDIFVCVPSFGPKQGRLRQVVKNSGDLISPTKEA